jgi:glutamyl-tRNA reductase
VEGVTSVLRRSGVLVRVGQDSAEQIRRREVSRALRKVDLSPEVEAEAVERMSRSLVGRLLHGPISRVTARAEVEISSTDRRNPEVSCGTRKAWERTA